MVAMLDSSVNCVCMWLLTVGVGLPAALLLPVCPFDAVYI